MNKRAKYELTGVMMLFGSIGLFVRYIPLPSGVTALARGVIGTLFLFAAAVVSKRMPSVKAVKENLVLLVLSGAAIGINWVCLFEAYRHTTIAVATVCYYLAPVFVLLAAAVCLKERLSVRKGICILSALLGTMLVSGIFSGEMGMTGAQGGSFSGIVWGITAAFFYAVVIMMNKFLKNISAMDATMTQLGVASVILLPYVVMGGEFGLEGMDARGYFFLIVVGILHTGAAYTVYFSCIPRLRSQTVAIFSYIDPASAIILSSLILGESLSPVEAVGAFLILGAAFLSDFRPGEKNRKSVSS